MSFLIILAVRDATATATSASCQACTTLALKRVKEKTNSTKIQLKQRTMKNAQ